MADLTDMFFESVTNIKGIGEKKRSALASIGINTVADLLNHFPYRYKDMRFAKTAKDATPGADELVEGRLLNVQNRGISGGRTITECVLEDKSGTFHLVFFNMPYLRQVLKLRSTYCIFGKKKLQNGISTWVNPEIFEKGSDKDKRGIVPVYHCTAGVNNNDFNKWISYILDEEKYCKEWIDEDILVSRNVCGRHYAYQNMHFPADSKPFRVAKYRMIYEQLLIYQLALRINKKRIDEESLDCSIKDIDISPFIDSLQFSLTEGQLKCIDEMNNDLVDTKRMNRLIQGDVGCGKTIVAEAAIYKCVKAGHQAAMMAPTELLARQHYANISRDMKKHGISCCLLISGLKTSERKSMIKDIAKGKFDVVIGTHAIIQDDIHFKDLALVVTDEQHRFGVNQRKTLVEKGRGVNVCVMSATPIPRTLAATVFGDMDFSIIKDKPADRLEIITRAVDSYGRERAYRAAINELDKGHQVYIVAPSIDNKDDEMQSAERLYKEAKKRFMNRSIALIHGKLDKDDKDEIMQDFAAGKYDVLVATVVIEVGIDVPNASMMIIENAERFGLAQMHQLRGRVGRSDIQSYCYLINYSNSDFAKERVEALVNISDGFEISEADFTMRGPGDIMGTMQSGNYSSDIVALCRYTDILNAAVSDAERIIYNPGKTDLSFVERYNDMRLASDNSNVI